MKKLVIAGIIEEFLLYLISVIFRINPMASCVLFVAGLLLLPVANRYVKCAKKREGQYREAVSYMEQLLCSYKRTTLPAAALSDCILLFPEDSGIRITLQRALNILLTGEGDRQNIVYEAFSVIDRKYMSRRMQMIHQYVAKAHQMGGNFSESLDILLRDLQFWKERNLVFQKKKNILLRDSFFSVFLALALCCLSLYFVPYSFRTILTDSLMYQITVAGSIFSYLIIIVVLLKVMADEWLDVIDVSSNKKKFRQDKNYNLVKKGKRGVSAHMAKKMCEREISEEFPYWLLSVILFLQQDNIFLAIQYSVEYTEGIFRREVEQFLARLYDDPVSLKPYCRFFEEYHLPEIQTAMKLLYAFRNNGYEDTSRQIYFLIEQNSILMNQAETKNLQNRLGIFTLLRQVPMMIAAIKIVTDMLLVLMMVVGKLLPL